MSRSVWKSTFRCICAWRIHLSIHPFISLIILSSVCSCIFQTLKFPATVTKHSTKILHANMLFCYMYVEYETISNLSYIAVAVKFFQLVPKLYFHEFRTVSIPKSPRAVEKSALQYLFFDLNFNIELLRFQQLFCREKCRSVYTKWRFSQWCFVIEWNVCCVIANNFLVTGGHFVLII